MFVLRFSLLVLFVCVSCSIAIHEHHAEDKNHQHNPPHDHKRTQEKPLPDQPISKSQPNSRPQVQEDLKAGENKKVNRRQITLGKLGNQGSQNQKEDSKTSPNQQEDQKNHQNQLDQKTQQNSGTQATQADPKTIKKQPSNQKNVQGDQPTLYHTGKPQISTTSRSGSKGKKLQNSTEPREPETDTTLEPEVKGKNTRTTRTSPRTTPRDDQHITHRQHIKKPKIPQHLENPEGNLAKV